MLKFRTLVDDHPFPLGRFYRVSGIDELPQLWNIMKGEMSFVGPRPLLPEYVSLYTVEQKLRHQVRPGLTGLVQVSGGKALSWESRLALDVEYVKHFSFLQDLNVLLKTLMLYVSFAKFSEKDFRSKFTIDKK